MGTKTDTVGSENQVTKDDLVRALEDSGAVLHGEFTLSSGKTSDYYIDKYIFETDPNSLETVGKGIAQKLEDIGAKKIACVALGAVPLAAIASVESGLPYVIVRKEKKEYGTSNLIEGELEEGEEVVVIEDHVTTGASANNAVDKLRDAGATVNHIIVVVDRQEGGKEAIKKNDLTFHSLLEAEDLDSV